MGEILEIFRSVPMFIAFLAFTSNPYERYEIPACSSEFGIRINRDGRHTRCSSVLLRSFNRLFRSSKLCAQIFTAPTCAHT